jgi:hypothetical protein
MQRKLLFLSGMHPTWYHTKDLGGDMHLGSYPLHHPVAAQVGVLMLFIQGQI